MGEGKQARGRKSYNEPDADLKPGGCPKVRALKTVETVNTIGSAGNTQLKQGVNETRCV